MHPNPSWAAVLTPYPTRPRFDALTAFREGLQEIYACEQLDALRSSKRLVASLVHQPHADQQLIAQLLKEHLDARESRLRERGLDGALSTLTRREREILLQLATGASDQEIAQQLTIARKTVSKHVENILRKLNVETRTAAAACYLHARQIPW